MNSFEEQFETLDEVGEYLGLPKAFYDLDDGAKEAYIDRYMKEKQKKLRRYRFVKDTTDQDRASAVHDRMHLKLKKLKHFQPNMPPKGAKQRDTEARKEIIRKILAENADVIEPYKDGGQMAVMLAQQNNTLNQQNIQNNLTQNNLMQNTLNQQNIQNIQNIIQTYPGIEPALATLFQGIQATFLNVSERNDALLQALNGLEMELKAEGGNTAQLASQYVQEQLDRFTSEQTVQNFENNREIKDNKARINKIGLITEALADGQSLMQATLEQVPEQLSSLPGRVIDALNQSANNPLNKLSGILEQAQNTVEVIGANGGSRGGEGDGGPGLQEQKMMNDMLKQIASALNKTPRMPWDDKPRTVDNYFATVPRFRKNPRAPFTVPAKVGARVIKPQGPKVYYVPQGFGGVQDK
ncbi:hypothetical protein GGF31_007593 [Allomyces arbusculus]|nr:hypothetical protein GGF31_007593 [Allomyces arbusculus]